jgi:phage terminase small subunit
MPILKNQRWELFAQGIAKGLTQGKAYVQAGYKPSPSAPSRLFENVRIKERVEELVGRKAVAIIINKQFVTEALIDNLEKALGRKPVKIGAEGKECYVYRGDVANRALQLIGIEMGMFADKREIKHVEEFSKLSDLELVLLLEQEAKRLLIEDHSGGGKDGKGRS